MLKVVQLRHLFPVLKASLLQNLCISILLRITDQVYILKGIYAPYVG